jgi:arginase family enzyme
LAVINLDAHLDIRNVLADHAPNSGTSFGRLIDAGLASYTVVGLRPFQNSATYLQKAECHDVQMISAETVFEKGAIAIAKKILKNLPARVRCIYLSVDVDVADASVAPGCSAPTSGGLLAHQVFQLVRTICADARTQACGIFEMAPNLEEVNNDRTARLAAGCLAEMIFSAVPVPIPMKSKARCR